MIATVLGITQEAVYAVIKRSGRCIVIVIPLPLERSAEFRKLANRQESRVATLEKESTVLESEASVTDKIIEN